MDTLKQFVATGIVLKLDGWHRTVLLVDHVKIGSWFFPGGHVEDNETPDAAAVREVFEETGIRAQLRYTYGPGSVSAETLQLPYCMQLESIAAHGETPFHHHIDMFYICYADHGAVDANTQEVRSCGFFTRAEALQLNMVMDMRDLINRVFADAKLWHDLAEHNDTCTRRVLASFP